VRFVPGQVVLRRWYALATTPHVVAFGRAVRDDHEGLLVWVPEGGPSRWIVAADGRARAT
jgi:hypothetical protein